MDNDANIFSTHCVAQRQEIAVKAFMEFLNRCKRSDGNFYSGYVSSPGEGVGDITSDQIKQYQPNWQAQLFIMRN